MKGARTVFFFKNVYTVIDGRMYWKSGGKYAYEF